MREYAPLTLTRLEHRSRVAEPMTPGRVTLDDPAFSVMTDLREVSAATTRPEETIDTAHAIMIRRAVRLLFVLDDDTTVCGEASCDRGGNTFQPEARCDGRGTCAARAGGISCAPFTCDAHGKACASTCKNEGECVAGNACANGSCYPTSCTGMPCDPGSVCYQNLCTEKSCVGVLCPQGQVCKAGACICAR